MKKPEENSKPVEHGMFPDERWVKKYPATCAYMADLTWDDGSPRDVATLTLRVEDGRLVLCLNDKEMQQTLYRSGGTIEEGLAALEKALTLGPADWRSWGGKGKKKK